MAPTTVTAGLLSMPGSLTSPRWRRRLYLLTCSPPATPRPVLASTPGPLLVQLESMETAAVSTVETPRAARAKIMCLEDAVDLVQIVEVTSEENQPSNITKMDSSASPKPPPGWQASLQRWPGPQELTTEAATPTDSAESLVASSGQSLKSVFRRVTSTSME